jgi:hypothetical protein
MRKNDKLQIQSLFLIGFLVGEYLLGMLTNLFVAFPQGSADWQQWEFARTQLLVISHIVLGLLLLAGAIVLYIRAFRAKDRTWEIASGVGLGSIFLAIVSGSAFISTQLDYYSLLMSLLFIVAVAAYGWGIYKTK